MGLNDEHEKLRQAKFWVRGKCTLSQWRAADEYLRYKLEEGAMHRLYIGNKMTDIPFFNAPWFDEAANALLKIPVVFDVFNPAEHDREQGFDPMQCPKGSKAESRAAGFDVRKALRADWDWIADYSTGMIVGPDWTRSPGARSEVACHQALGLPVWEYEIFLKHYASDSLDQFQLSNLRPPSYLWTEHIGMLDEDEDDYDGLVCDC